MKQTSVQLRGARVQNPTRRCTVICQRKGILYLPSPFRAQIGCDDGMQQLLEVERAAKSQHSGFESVVEENVCDAEATMAARATATTATRLTNHVKHEVPYQEAQCHSTAKQERSG